MSLGDPVEPYGRCTRRGTSWVLIMTMRRVKRGTASDSLRTVQIGRQDIASSAGILRC